LTVYELQLFFGRQKSTPTEVNIAAVADLVKNDRRVASRMIAESLNITKTAVLRILKEDLGKRKLCALCVQHSLTAERTKHRVITAVADADKHFFNEIVTGNATWCFACDPQTKRLSSEWAEENEIPEVPHQDHVSIFSTLKAQCTKNSYLRKNSK
jgi:hypothetical protein